MSTKTANITTTTTTSSTYRRRSHSPASTAFSLFGAILQVAFFSCVAIYLYLACFGPDNYIVPIDPDVVYKVRLVTKASPAILLIFMSWRWARRRNNNSTRGIRLPLTLISLGMIASAGGDIFLQINDRYDSEDTFLQGLASFLVAHCFFFTAFSISYRPRKSDSDGDHLPGYRFVKLRLLRAIPFALYAAVALRFVTSKPGANFPGFFYGALGAYATILTLFGWRAAARFGDDNVVATTANAATNRSNRVMRLLGTILFIFSDTLIALSSFRNDIVKQDVNVPKYVITLSIMLTYWLAQYLIAYSTTEYSDIVQQQQQQQQQQQSNTNKKQQ